MAEKKKRSRGMRRSPKDRVLQARIPQQLDEELRDRAEDLGLSVSTIVRNVLLNTFDLVEGVVSDSAQIGKALQGRAGGQPELAAPGASHPEEPAPVLGWQEAILNLNGVCEQCNTILHRGERAAVGVPAQSRPVLLCLSCLESLSTPAPEQEDQDTN